MDGSYVAFSGHRRIAGGPLRAVARAVKEAMDGDIDAPIAVFDDATGRLVDLDLRGTPDEVVARVDAEAVAPPAPRRGRPRLGVVPREVTLLPRHWDWLSTQRGGASATLRRLVEAARKADEPDEEVRRGTDAAYRFMSAMGGDLPGFEEAARALYAGDVEGVRREVRGWPPDLRDHVHGLIAGLGRVASR